jgi:GntR family transcriptional regulator
MPLGVDGFYVPWTAQSDGDDMSETLHPEATSANGADSSVKMTRYQQVANILLAEIEGGEYAVGSLMPTEHELCERFNVSRYTVREALRRLFEAGLVARRRGAGTTVIALKRPPLFDLAVSSVIDIFKYAKNTQFEIKDVSAAILTSDLREDLGLSDKNQWAEILGLRYSDIDPRPVGLSRFYVNKSFEQVTSRLDQPHHIIRDFSEIAFEIPVGSMEQSIRAAGISESDGQLLKVDPGSPGLRLIRRYLAKDGKVIQVTDNIHPADRFSLSMTYDHEVP